MRAALVSKETKRVENIIVWEPGSNYDPGPEFLLVPLEEGEFVDIGWYYDQEADAFYPDAAQG